MTETSVTETICNICGVEVRDGSQFCYYCGSSVSALQEPDKASDREIVTMEDSRAIGSSADLKTPTPSQPAKNRAQNGARRRNRNRTIAPKEVAWVEPEGIGIRFLLTTILLTIVAASLLVLALYLR